MARETRSARGGGEKAEQHDELPASHTAQPQRVPPPRKAAPPPPTNKKAPTGGRARNVTAGTTPHPRRKSAGRTGPRKDELEGTDEEEVERRSESAKAGFEEDSDADGPGEDDHDSQEESSEDEEEEEAPSAQKRAREDADEVAAGSDDDDDAPEEVPFYLCLNIDIYHILSLSVQNNVFVPQ